MGPQKQDHFQHDGVRNSHILFNLFLTIKEIDDI